MTPQREAVLAAVKAAANHPSAEEIFLDVQRTAPGIGVATVYRTLDLLVRHGRLLQLRLPDETVTRYDANVGKHQHVICSTCDAVFDVVVDLPEALLAAAGSATGVRIDAYDLQLRGICAACSS